MVCVNDLDFLTSVDGPFGDVSDANAISMQDFEQSFREHFRDHLRAKNPMQPHKPPVTITSKCAVCDTSKLQEHISEVTSVLLTKSEIAAIVKPDVAVFWDQIHSLAQDLEVDAVTLQMWQMAEAHAYMFAMLVGIDSVGAWEERITACDLESAQQEIEDILQQVLTTREVEQIKGTAAVHIIEESLRHLDEDLTASSWTMIDVIMQAMGMTQSSHLTQSIADLANQLATDIETEVVDHLTLRDQFTCKLEQLVVNLVGHDGIGKLLDESIQTQLGNLTVGAGDDPECLQAVHALSRLSWRFVLRHGPDQLCELIRDCTQGSDDAGTCWMNDILRLHNAAIGQPYISAYNAYGI